MPLEPSCKIMVCLGQTDIPSAFADMTTRSQTAHGSPSVQLHIRPGERFPRAVKGII